MKKVKDEERKMMKKEEKWESASYGDEEIGKF